MANQGSTNSKSLYREAAVAGARARLLGGVSVIAPPSVWVAVVVALLSFGMLLAAAYAVEVPQRVHAIGVVMPSGGLHTIAAMQSGRVSATYVKEGDHVQSGDLLARVSADRSMPGSRALQVERLSSLRRERSLLQRHGRQREYLAESYIASLPEQVRLADARLAAARQELAAQQQRRHLHEQKLARYRQLLMASNLSADTVRATEAELLLVVAAVAELEQRITQFELEAGRLRDQQQRLVIEQRIDAFTNAAEQERLSREMNDTESRINEDIRAPAAAVITHTYFSRGSHVLAGQALFSWHSPDDAIEAWLYVPARDSGRLELGQSVELSFDAFPAQSFGTQKARIQFISTTALLPTDLNTPVILREPVFEVRAALASSAIEDAGKRWSFWPGASFKADIVQHRFRLYEWLMKSRRRDS